MAYIWSMATASLKSASSQPGLERMACVSAATEESFMSPIAALKVHFARMAREALLLLILPRGGSKWCGPSPAGSPDMGNVSADGRWLWLSGRFDRVVYRIDTASGEMKSIAVGKEPHGLTVWPQPGRYSLGHTGNLR